MRIKLGVSDIVAAMLLLLIVVAVGTSLYLYLYSRAIAYQQSVSQELIAEEIRSKQQLAILLVHGNSTSQEIQEITVIVASGEASVEINAIYVNETLASTETITVNPESVVEIRVQSPIALSSGDVVKVKIVYAGGYLNVEASGEVT